TLNRRERRCDRAPPDPGTSSGVTPYPSAPTAACAASAIPGLPSAAAACSYRRQRPARSSSRRSKSPRNEQTDLAESTSVITARSPLVEGRLRHRDSGERCSAPGHLTNL